MFVFIGGLGTTSAYATPWMRQLARLHGELFYFVALKDASIQHLEYILQSVVIPWCRQNGERVTLVGYSAGCSVLLHAFHGAFKDPFQHIKVLLIDPPALFPAWATATSEGVSFQKNLNPSYVPLIGSVKHRFTNIQPRDSLLNTLLFGNPKNEIAARVLQSLLSITAGWSLPRWIMATGWCMAEGWTTPWAVNADILRMTLPELRASLMESILQYPAYACTCACCYTGCSMIKHVWASTEKKSYATYASLLAEHSPFIVTHFKRDMDHHMLVRQTRHLYV